MIQDSIYNEEVRRRKHAEALVEQHEQTIAAARDLYLAICYHPAFTAYVAMAEVSPGFADAFSRLRAALAVPEGDEK